MSAISFKSITGITSITTPAGADNQFTLHNNNTTEAVKLDIAGNIHINNQLVVAGVSTFSGHLMPGTDSAYNIGSSSVRFANVYADTLYGNGANLTGIDTDLVSDTSPQLGGDLASNSHDILFADNDKAIFGTGSDFKIYHNGTDNYIMASNGHIRFDTGSAELARITSGGDLLIGTSTAAISAGKGLMIADAAGARIKLCDSDQGVTASDGFEIIASNGGNAFIYNRENSPIIIGTNNTERMRITHEGSVGIGTDGSTYELEVHDGTGAAALRMKDGANNVICDLIANSTGGLLRTTYNHPLVFHTNQTERLRITNDGKIGINETSPQQQLHVHDDNNYQGILINGNVAPRIAFARTTTTTGEWSVGIDGTNGNQFVINNSNDNSNRKLIISSTQISSSVNHSMGGNVIIANAGSGIDFSATANGGTGTPSELLDDYEEGYFAPEITNLSSGYGSGTFYNRQARYTKVGNMVTCWVHIQFWGTASTSGSDNLELTVTGFPFEVDGVGYSGSCGGGLQSQSWRYSGSTWNNYATTSNNVQPRINSLEQIRFGVCGHNGITGQVTQKSINGYAPNIEFVFTVRVTTYK